MLSKATIKFIQSLKQKKNRMSEFSFIVEGRKMVEEATKSQFEVELILTTNKDTKLSKAQLIDSNTMKKLSSFSTPSDFLAVLKMGKTISNIDSSKELVLLLDGVNDPGNLGTIMRIADWFGINQVICSKDTVDVYNPKTIQSTMGALFRVQVSYVNLEEYILDQITSNKDLPVYGALMDGNSIYKESLSSNGLVIMGSESHGIRPNIEKLLTNRITIPGAGRSESLNVGVAAGIVCSEFFRKK